MSKRTKLYISRVILDLSQFIFNIAKSDMLYKKILVNLVKLNNSMKELAEMNRN